VSTPPPPAAAQRTGTGGRQLKGQQVAGLRQQQQLQQQLHPPFANTGAGRQAVSLWAQAQQQRPLSAGLSASAAFSGLRLTHAPPPAAWSSSGPVRASQPLPPLPPPPPPPPPLSQELLLDGSLPRQPASACTCISGPPPPPASARRVAANRYVHNYNACVALPVRCLCRYYR